MIRKTLYGLASAALVLVLGGLVIVACNSKPAFQTDQAFEETAAKVIIPTYEDFVVVAKSLHEATQALCKSVDDASLEKAQNAWKETKLAWKRAEPFRFGPAKQLDARGHIDWWPIKIDSIEKEIAGTTDIDTQFVANLGASRRGLVTIEYLLFGTSKDGKGPKEALSSGDHAKRRCDYTSFLAEGVWLQGQKLVAAWKEQPSAERIKLFYEMGDPDVEPVFLALNKSTNEIVVALASAMDMRIAKPTGRNRNGEIDPTLVESPYAKFSGESLLAFLTGIERFYLGEKDGQGGLSLSALVKYRKAEMDAAFRAELRAAITAAKALSTPFQKAMVEQKEGVEKTYQAIRQARITASTDLVSLLGVTLTFSDNDGDS